MSQPYYNDQAYIAENFRVVEEINNQAAILALFKINSYKLSLSNKSFLETRKELEQIIKDSLLNYIDPAIVLCNMEFFITETEN